MEPKRRNSALAEPGDHPEDALLLGDAEPGLEAHEVPHLPRPVLAAELHHGVRVPAGARVAEAHRLHGAEAKRLGAAARHLLHGEAALEVGHLVELVGGELVRRGERGEERLVLLARHGAVEVVVAVALAVAGQGIDHRLVDRLPAHDRRNRVVERQRRRLALLERRPRRSPFPRVRNGRIYPAATYGVGGRREGVENRAGQRLRRERPGGDDAGGRELRHLARDDADPRVRGDPLVRQAREHLAVHRQRGAGGHPRLIRDGEQERAEPAQLVLEQAVRVAEVGGLEGVAADELGQAAGLVGRRGHRRAHLVELDVDPPLGEGPRGFRAREPPADDGDGHVAATSSASITTTRCWHLRQVRVSPSALETFFSMPTKPQLGQVSTTGRFQVEKSHAG